MPKKPQQDIRLTTEDLSFVKLDLSLERGITKRKTPDLAILSPLYFFEDEPADCTAWRERREKEAEGGNVTALADLIRFSAYYLTCPLTIATIRVLRSKLVFAKTGGDRARASAALDCLAHAMRGGDLRGNRPHAPAKDVRDLYERLLPLYAQTRRGNDAVKDPDSINLPPWFACYFEGRPLPNGVVRNPPPPKTRKVVLWTPTHTSSPTFATVVSSGLPHVLPRFHPDHA